MMDYSDYMSNMQTAVSNLYGGATTAMQPVMESMTSMLRGSAPTHHKHDCGCHHHECECCIRCADVVEYARCGELRRIPVKFENETRRQRDVKLEISPFLTDTGQDLGWEAALSQTGFTLAPCGHQTVLIGVRVECGDTSTNPTTGTNPTVANNPTATDTRQTVGTVKSCKVGYATLRGDGCIVRPLVIAVAVLPDHCGAHHADCGCGCC